MGVYGSCTSVCNLPPCLVLPATIIVLGVTFSIYSSSTYSSPICTKPGNVRVGLVPLALILLVLAALHVVEPIARNKSVGNNKDEYWTKMLQHLRLVALIVVLFFLGYQQSKIHTNNWLWAI